MRRSLVLVLALFLAAGCKDEPKDQGKSSAVKQPEKIPEDFVMNEFFQDGKSARTVIADASLGEGGLLTSAPAGGDGGAGAGSDEDAPATDRKFKVTEPGADPKVRRYAFLPKTETRKMTLVASVIQEVQGQRQNQEQPPVVLTLAFTPKAKGGHFRLESILKKIELSMPPNADPKMKEQATAEFAALQGVGVSMDVTARGGLADLKFEGKQVPRGAEEMLQLITQAFDVVLAPLPEEPIGVGGRWEEHTTGKEQNVETKNTTTFTLKELVGDAFVIEASILRKAAKQPLKGDQRVPPGAMIEIDAKGQYTYEGKLGGVAQKVSGELVTTIKIEVPKKPAKIEQVQILKVKHQIETPK